MPEHPSPRCDVVDCGRPPAGSYLHATDARSVEFAVCDTHLSSLKAGRQPTVVAERPDVGGRPALLIPPSAGDD